MNLEEVANIIKEKGYEIGSQIGSRVSVPAQEVIGILKSNEKMLHIGNLWLHDSKWVLDVYGSDYLEEMKELGEEVACLYGVTVKTVLKNEQPLTGEYPAAFGGPC